MLRVSPSTRRHQAVRHFPEGFYADRCLFQMSAAPPVQQRECTPLASARLDPKFLARLQRPNTEREPRAAPILLVKLTARA
jgi:hypothetical protein